MVQEGKDDTLVWGGLRMIMFAVASFYRKLVRVGDVAFPWKGIWRMATSYGSPPKKVTFFAGMATWQAILLTDDLRILKFLLD